MEEITDLKKRVDHLEYDEIKPMKSEMSDMKVTLSNNDLLTKQAVESNQRLSDTMDSFKETMIEMAQSLKDANRISSELANTVVSLNAKIDETNAKMDKRFEEYNNKIEDIDDKSKVDILVWLRNNWFGFVGIIGVIYAIVTQVTSIK